MKLLIRSVHKSFKQSYQGGLKYSAEIVIGVWVVFELDKVGTLFSDLEELGFEVLW